MSRYIRQAVALAYGKNPVPVVTAKGDDDLAMRMIEEARQQGVFISEDPQLLALLSRLNVDEEIPQELYTAVAWYCLGCIGLRACALAMKKQARSLPIQTPHQQIR